MHDRIARDGLELNDVVAQVQRTKGRQRKTVVRKDGNLEPVDEHLWIGNRQAAVVLEAARLAVRLQGLAVRLRARPLGRDFRQLFAGFQTRSPLENEFAVE